MRFPPREQTIRRCLCILIQSYQHTLSPLWPLLFGAQYRCRFFPTCSEYFLEALRQYRLSDAIMFSLKRISRCHPWSEGGYDPLPHHIHQE